MNPDSASQSLLPDLLPIIAHAFWTLLDGPIGLVLLGFVALRLLVWYLGLVKRRFDRFCRHGY